VLPDEVEDLAFHVLGVPGETPADPFARSERTLIVSPFIGPAGLARVTRSGWEHILVTTSEALGTIRRDALAPFSRIAVISDSASLLDIAQHGTPGDQDAPVQEGQELHAKIYVTEHGRLASLFTGSANATDAAFTGNVELLVELIGSKRTLGIDVLLQPRAVEEPSFGDLLVDVDVDELSATSPEVDEAASRLEAALKNARIAVSLAGITAKATPLDEEGAFELTVALNQELDISHVALVCWPIHLGAALGKPLADTPSFPLRAVDISSFVAVEASAEMEGRRADLVFVVNAELIGAPDDRERVVLRQVLHDKDRILKFLLFLLAAGDGRATADVLFGEGEGGDETATSVWRRWVELPIFESLIRSLADDPNKVDRVKAMVEDLGAQDVEELLPGLTKLLDPILEAREALR
jgi:hypothetical protein